MPDNSPAEQTGSSLRAILPAVAGVAVCLLAISMLMTMVMDGSPEGRLGIVFWAYICIGIAFVHLVFLLLLLGGQRLQSNRFCMGIRLSSIALLGVSLLILFDIIMDLV